VHAGQSTVVVKRIHLVKLNYLFQAHDLASRLYILIDLNRMHGVTFNGSSTTYTVALPKNQKHTVTYHTQPKNKGVKRTSGTCMEATR
jgi:hypothetical protein